MFVFNLYIMLCSISITYSARILAIIPSPSYSHQLVARSVLLDLHSRGHEIFILTTDPLGSEAPNNNYTEINLNFIYKYINSSGSMDRWTNAINKYRIISMLEVYAVSGRIAEEIFALEEVKDLINNKRHHFDLVIFEWSSYPTYTAFAEHFNCPLIGFRSLGLKVEIHDVLANPVTPSYLPVAFMRHGEDFIGRVVNTLLVFSIRFIYQFIVLPYADNIANNQFPNHKTYIGDLEKNVSITFTYTNQILLGVRPYVPSLVEIGGLHLGRRNKTIPKDIQTYLDNSKQGVIYFSFGSQVSTKAISKDKLNVLAETFMKLPYNIILKADVYPFNETIKNVKCFKWLPQEAILGHPNVRLFVSHSGIMSFFESVSNRVPIIGIPFHTDQFYNAFRIVELGIGLQLDFQNLGRTDLLYAINEIMTNHSYKQRIETIAQLIEDQQLAPVEKVVWWTEYVLRHKGAPHFRSKAVGMPWYIFYSLDVICFIIFILMVISYIIYRILKFIHSIFCIKNKKEKIQ